MGGNLMKVESDTFLQRSSKISPSKTSSLEFLSFPDGHNSCELCIGLQMKHSERG